MTCKLLACFLSVLASSGAAQWRHFGTSSLAHEMLRSHNAVRSRVGVAPLKWSDDLAARAQEWADGLLASGKFAHNLKSGYGENLYEIRGATTTADQVVEAWASEAREYGYSSNKCRGVCGHYTQIVWRDTKEVGCAVARGRGREIWVCEYDPPGNVVGRRPY